VILIVAGVSGSGKSTVGALLARGLHWRFADGDDFHSKASIAKMTAGIPLTDEDRQPWLQAMGDWMDTQIAAGRSCVLACSALKRAYRDRLLAGRPSVLMIFLDVDKNVLAERLAARHGHFFHEQLLQSQLDALEPPAPDERVRVVREAEAPLQTAAKIAASLWPEGKPAGTPDSEPDTKPDGEPGAAQ
jgi:carbohydrate kinase (thermoresistant glucokinase family)